MTIFVGNLSFRTSEDDLRCVFQNYGTVRNAKIATDRDTGRRRGFAFIEMQNDGEAARAISALNGKELDRRALTVNAARTREHQVIGAQNFGDQIGTGPSRSFGPLECASRSGKCLKRPLLALLKFMPEASQIAENQHYETEWEELRLVVEKRPDHWQAFVYDVENCEVLHTVEEPTADAAKLAALEFAATHTFGAKHGLKLQVVATMLIWEPAL